MIEFFCQHTYSRITVKSERQYWQNKVSSYFLQEYLTGTPNCFTATLNGDPALKSFFFPLYDRIVMLRHVRMLDGAPVIDGVIPKP